MTLRMHGADDLPGRDQIFVFPTTQSGTLNDGNEGAKLCVNLRVMDARNPRNVVMLATNFQEGRVGTCYALPTHDVNSAFLSMSELSIHLDRFVDYVKAHDELDFFISRPVSGCVTGGIETEVATNLGRLLSYENVDWPLEWHAVFYNTQYQRFFPSDGCENRGWTGQKDHHSRHVGKFANMQFP